MSLTAQPYFDVSSTGTQTVSNGTETQVTIFTASPTTNIGSNVTYTGGNFTVLSSGTYLITGRIGFAANATGGRRGTLYQNGSALGLFLLPGLSSSSFSNNLSVTAALNANDVVTLGAYQTSGGDLVLNGSRMTIVKLF